MRHDLGIHHALGDGPVTLNDANTLGSDTALLATVSAAGDTPIANSITVANPANLANLANPTQPR